ncbi:MAG: hypothetical protein ACREJB_07560, partial [Planctomycetaceae bacterium]
MKTRRRILAAVVPVALLATGCAPLPEPAAPGPAAPSSAAVGGTTLVAVSPPAAAHPTLFDFLGVTQLCQHLHADIEAKRNHLGTYFPFIEEQPPLLAISDPALLDSPNPAVAVAAEVKAEEDAAAQKVKAINYLATIGCVACYPEVEAALIAALHDCTEAVRFAAVEALRDLAGSPCKRCKAKSCCGLEVRKALLEVAYGKDGLGCSLEPSPRVRRVARLALQACGCEGLVGEGVPLDPEPPIEGPTPEELGEPLIPPPPPEPGLEPPPPEGAPEGGVVDLGAGDIVLARVNGEPIFESEILAEVNRRLATAQADGEQLTPGLRRQMIREELD